MANSKKPLKKEDLTKSLTHERPKPKTKPPTSRESKKNINKEKK